jgi:hypothetical protein
MKTMWIMEIDFSILHRISTSYACRRNSNRFKWFIIYVYLPIRYSHTENNTTNLGVCVWQYELGYSPEQQLVLRRFGKMR